MASYFSALVSSCTSGGHSSMQTKTFLGQPFQSLPDWVLVLTQWQVVVKNLIFAQLISNAALTTIQIHLISKNYFVTSCVPPHSKLLSASFWLAFVDRVSCLSRSFQLAVRPSHSVNIDPFSCSLCPEMQRLKKMAVALFVQWPKCGFVTLKKREKSHPTSKSQLCFSNVHTSFSWFLRGKLTSFLWCHWCQCRSIETYWRFIRGLFCNCF